MSKTLSFGFTISFSPDAGFTQNVAMSITEPEDQPKRPAHPPVQRIIPFDEPKPKQKRMVRPKKVKV